MENSSAVEQKLDVLIDLARQLLALELAKSGLKQTEIGKRLHIATKTVNSMLKGVGKDG